MPAGLLRAGGNCDSGMGGYGVQDPAHPPPSGAHPNRRVSEPDRGAGAPGCLAPTRMTPCPSLCCSDPHNDGAVPLLGLLGAGLSILIVSAAIAVALVGFGAACLWCFDMGWGGGVEVLGWTGWAAHPDRQPLQWRSSGAARPEFLEGGKFACWAFAGACCSKGCCKVSGTAGGGWTAAALPLISSTNRHSPSPPLSHSMVSTSILQWLRRKIRND